MNNDFNGKVQYCETIIIGILYHNIRSNAWRFIINTKEVIKKIGTQVHVAKTLGIRQSTVQSWVAHNRIPAERAKELYLKFNGIVKLHEMRPDLWERC